MGVTALRKEGTTPKVYGVRLLYAACTTAANEEDACHKVLLLAIPSSCHPASPPSIGCQGPKHFYALRQLQSIFYRSSSGTNRILVLKRPFLLLGYDFVIFKVLL